MDGRRFDVLATMVANGSTRRSLARHLAGGGLGALLGALGLAEAAEARRRRRRRCIATGGCPGNQVCSVNGRCVSPLRCNDNIPDCPACEGPLCDTPTGFWVCGSRCHEGFSCCGEHCLPPCPISNGCERNPGDGCTCTKPKAGDVFCAIEGICGANPCRGGEEYDSTTCTCRCPAGSERCGAGCCPSDRIGIIDGRRICASPCSGCSGWWCD
jgi:hypothetical protein